MSEVRLVLRLSASAGWTLVLFAVWALLAPLALVAGALWRWRACIRQVWSRGMCRILGVRLAVEGRPPAGGCLLVANHLSYLDVVVLGALCPCAFVAKREVAGWPVIGFVARAMGTLFVERERKRSLADLNRVLARRLARGETLVLFPEGTSSPGERVLPFRPALLAPAVELGAPVAYAALAYATPPGAPPAAEAVCWWGDMTFGAHVLALVRLAHVEAGVRFGSEPLTAPDRKVLAARLHGAVAARLQPLPHRYV